MVNTGGNGPKAPGGRFTRVASRRRLAVAGALLALGLAAAAGAGANERVRLPRDHFAHRAAGIEWWYVTGLVRARDGRRYTVFFTLFRRGGIVLPISQVVDLRRDAIVGHSERLARATSAPGKLDVAAGGARLAYAPRTNSWLFRAAGPGYALSLAARPRKPYALHGGGTGVIRQSVGGPSAYYSATRMSASGTITLGARRIPFAGTAWLDHQWGSFVDDPRAFNWDWFSCRFDDRTELMLYRFRDRHTGAPLTEYRNGTYVHPDGATQQVRAFTASGDGSRWPQRWHLRVPTLGLDLRLRSLARNQLFRGVLVPTFWEGASSVTGTKRGDCFVEVTYR
jgi:predicted secreted hydrolase